MEAKLLIFLTWALDGSEWSDLRSGSEKHKTSALQLNSYDDMHFIARTVNGSSYLQGYTSHPAVGRNLLTERHRTTCWKTVLLSERKTIETTKSIIPFPFILDSSAVTSLLLRTSHTRVTTCRETIFKCDSPSSLA